MSLDGIEHLGEEGDREDVVVDNGVERPFDSHASVADVRTGVRKAYTLNELRGTGYTNLRDSDELDDIWRRGF